ncbi:MAG TPA: hypothetical protein VFS43_07340 [Polyangiaceae bacterium]|nr:hypothetical protein [Polyangiaceae bacterium]
MADATLTPAPGGAAKRAADATLTPAPGGAAKRAADAGGDAGEAKRAAGAAGANGAEPKGAAKAPPGASRAAAEPRGLKRSWRQLLRALHRDAGYLAVGLTIIYAVSGLAVNHIADWDPNFQSYERTTQVGRLEGDDDAIAAQALAKLGVAAKPQEVYRASADRLEITLDDKRSVHLDTEKGVAIEEGQQPRFFLRLANWLHLNRGKPAWRYIADAYAAGLLLLAVSGLFMIPGKKGLKGRGAALVLAGIALPTLYVAFAGGPGAPAKRPGPAPGAQNLTPAPD